MMMFGDGFGCAATIARYTVAEALKNRILLIAMVFALVGLFAAGFAGDVSVIEAQQTRIAFLSAIYRFCAVFAMMILVASTIAREFNDKCLELYLSLPISRTTYYCGKLFGFWLAGLAPAAVFGGVMLFYADAAVVGVWFVSLFCELALMATITFFAVLTFNNQLIPSFSAAFFFYFLSRLTVSIKLISEADILLHTAGVKFFAFVAKVLFLVLPSLENFTRSEWLMYADIDAALSALPLILLQTAIYGFVIAAASLIDFRRKNI